MAGYRLRQTVAIVLGLGVVGALLFRTSRPQLLHLGTVSLAQAKNTETGGAAGRNSAPPTVPVSVATVSHADIPVRLNALGSVTAFNTVTVRPRVDGQLMRVLFREGQFVARGDLLAEVDPRPFQVQLEQSEGQLARDQAQLSNARVDLTRYQTLLSQDSIAQQNV